MRYKEITEAVTSQSFKFGFELECIGPSGFDIDTLSLPVELKQSTDDSILVDGEEGNDEQGYEFISSPMLLNPKNITASKQTVISMLKNGFRTNGSCGFHIHYSFETMDFSDMCWFLLGLATDENSKSYFSMFNDIEFFNDRYADTSFFDNILAVVQSGENRALAHVFNADKFRILRMHPQGTIEWRGPRDFMNSGDMSLISDFFLRLYKCADIIHKLSTKESISLDGKTITKREFVSNLNNSSASATGSFMKKGNSLDKSITIDYYTDISRHVPWLNELRFKNLNISYENSMLIIHSGEIVGGTVRECLLNGIEVSNSYIIGANAVNTMVTSCKVSKIQAQGCGFEKSIIEDSQLVECEFERSSIKNSTVDGQQIKDEKIQ